MFKICYRRNLREKTKMTLANQNRRWKQLKRRLKRNPCVPSLSDPGDGWVGWREVCGFEDGLVREDVKIMGSTGRKGGGGGCYVPPPNMLSIFQMAPQNSGWFGGLFRVIFLRAALGWKVWLFCVESNCLPKLSTDEKSTLQPFSPKFQVLFALSFREGEIYEVSSFPSSLGWIIPMWWPWWLCFSCTAWARSILVSQFMFILYNMDSYSIHSSVDLPCFHLNNLKLALSCESTHR